MTTTADIRILPPTLATAVHLFEVLAIAYPAQTARHAYTDSKGEPHCIVAHAYEQLGGDLRVFEGVRPNAFSSTTRLPTLMNHLAIRHGWEYFFNDDSRSPLVKWDAKSAESFIVSSVFIQVQAAADQSSSTWRTAVIKGLTKTRAYLTSETSGFLVQTRGELADVRDSALATIDPAISRLRALSTHLERKTA